MKNLSKPNPLWTNVTNVHRGEHINLLRQIDEVEHAQRLMREDLTVAVREIWTLHSFVVQITEQILFLRGLVFALLGVILGLLILVLVMI